MSQPDSGPGPDALEAVVRAFVASRLARRLVDQSGEVGALAVQRCRPISGARRASNKAQVALEEAARDLEQARDRWGALARGLGADLAIIEEELAERTRAHVLELALGQALRSLEAARQWSATLTASQERRLGQAEEIVSGLLSRPADGHNL